MCGATLALAAALAPGGEGAEPAAAKGAAEPVEMRVWGLPEGRGYDAVSESLLRTLAAFRGRHPEVSLLSDKGLTIPGGRGQDVQTLMQIAGDVAPDVMFVNFRQSDTYVRSKFLYPLDRYVETTAGLSIPDGPLLDTPAYFARLAAGPNYVREFGHRIFPPAWEVMRRECPDGADCPYVREWGRAGGPRHFHLWCLPHEPLMTALVYRKDLFAEAGLPDRVPATCEELIEWARQIMNPKDNVYGLGLPIANSGWATLGFLYSYGGRAVTRDAQGNWQCVFNSDAGVDAYHFVARLFLEPFTNRHGRFTTVVNVSQDDRTAIPGMSFTYLSMSSLQSMNPTATGFGPVPRGPAGTRGGEFNASMTGIYAGVTDPRRRDLAWEYMRFRSGPEARRIRADVFVHKGMGRFLSAKELEDAGYADEVANIPAGWEEARREVLAAGVPEPYGRNCQQVYQYLNMAVDQIRNDDTVRAAILAGDAAAAKRRIREILDARVALANVKMLNILPPEVRTVRTRVAAAVAAAIVVIFALVFRFVFRTFAGAQASSPVDRHRGGWQVGRHKMAYLILLPALLSIGLWAYYPLARGTVLAFQDYNPRGFSRWIGFENFAAVLFSSEFWFALWVSVKYTAIFMTFGFGAPIVLALLLTEVPRGKILYRTIFYLPAVLSGVIVIFLWKGFYGQNGMINQVLNIAIHAINAVFRTHIADAAFNWLAEPRFALLFCLLPTIWAGMGPGCLIYLAALKTVPDELYEAADIDGAGVREKVWHITLPSIRALIAINFIGALIGAMHSGSGYILAMTGGGPYTPRGETEVIGLHIFWEAFGFLRFGVATAMAWVLGVMLIGFTVVRLEKMSKLEFKAAGGGGK